MLWCMVAVLVVVWCGGCGADVFTSMSDMHTLLHTEGEVLRTMESYITSQEARLAQMRKDVAKMGDVHRRASLSPDQFLGHPINAFLLVKRLTLDWADMQSTLTQDTVGQAVLANLTKQEGVLNWPDEEDLSGVATALMRLQDTYKLDTALMAQGYINDLPPAYRQLSASDCFELGRQSYNQGDHYHTILWMSEAMDRLDDSENSPDIISSNPVSKADILEYLAFSNYMQGKVKHALHLTNELLELRPTHQRAHGNKIYYEEALKYVADGKRGEDGEEMLKDEALENGYTVAEEVEDAEGETAAWQRERHAYERLCRGEVRTDPERDVLLSCYYQRGPHPLLRLGPVRTEVAHIDPTIYIYHNVLGDDEIETIKQLALPRFKRATVQNYKTGALETASYRISKSAWLREEEHDTVQAVNKRIFGITGLEMSTAEELQVANYGVGGHYEPHYDYARREEQDAFKSLGTGNRIATFLFYMSAVTGGGATVFPQIETALWPERGSAAFWYNLHPSGEGDALTRHAACPVLLGEKWVSNKWIHERGQEFIRKCDLEREV